MSYKITYTLKNPDKNDPIFHHEYFNSYNEANDFIGKNVSRFYWSQIVKVNPKSVHGKMILDAPVDLERYDKKTGTLRTHFETGMECLGLVFVEDGIHGPPNPDFDSSLPESRHNFKNYASYDALHFLNSGQILEVEEKLIELIKDRNFAIDDGHQLSFYPRGFTKDEWLQLFYPDTVKANLYIPKIVDK